MGRSADQVFALLSMVPPGSVTITDPSVTSWTSPVTGVITVQCWGPGGNGGTGASGNAGAGGGGGGGVSLPTPVNVIAGVSYPIQIGTPGVNTSFDSGAVEAGSGQKGFNGDGPDSQTGGEGGSGTYPGGQGGHGGTGYLGVWGDGGIGAESGGGAAGGAGGNSGSPTVLPVQLLVVAAAVARDQNLPAIPGARAQTGRS